MSEAYREGWDDYRRALYLEPREVAWLCDAAATKPTDYFSEWLKGWMDAAEADTTLMD